MELKDIYDFDFDSGDEFVFAEEYDLTNDDEVKKIDKDAFVALAAVKELGLSYDIQARHDSRVIDGERETDVCNVSWYFWKTDV